MKYSEYNYITRENVLALKPLIDSAVIKEICDCLPGILSLAKKLSYTLVYNDFWYDKVVVGGDEAFMFGYDLLGAGCIYADISNVISALGRERGEVFLDFYGRQNIPANEAKETLVLGSISSLIMANKMPKLPKYAQELIEKINSEKFITALQSIKVNDSMPSLDSGAIDGDNA